MRYKAGVALKVNYVALKKSEGLTDLQMTVYDEAGVMFGSPITMTEIQPESGHDPLGLYTASFTPDAVGQWRIRIESATNKDDTSKIFEVQLTSEDDIKAQTQSTEDKVDVIDTEVGEIKIVADATKVVVDAIEDKIDIIDTVVDDTKTVVDATKVVVDDTKTVVDATKTVVDSTATAVNNVAIDVASIKAIVEALDLQIDAGGYIL